MGGAVMKKRDYHQDFWKYIPEGWSLENYSCAARMSLSDWYENLSFRVHSPSVQLIKAYCSDTDKAPPLYEIYRRRLIEQRHGLLSVRGEFICSGCGQVHGDHIEKRPGFLYVEIDIAAPNEVIVNQFTAWLKTIRESLGNHMKAKPLSSADLDRWAQNRVLPFLDIERWCIGQSLTPTNAVLVRILFPDIPAMHEDKIRKTTRLVADECRSPELLDKMELQLAYQEFKKV